MQRIASPAHSVATSAMDQYLHFFFQHLQGTALATTTDKSARISKPNIPPFENYGWAKQDDKIEPVPSTQPTWPEKMTKTICQCAKGCKIIGPVVGRKFHALLGVSVKDVRNQMMLCLRYVPPSPYFCRALKVCQQPTSFKFPAFLL